MSVEGDIGRGARRGLRAILNVNRGLRAILNVNRGLRAS